MAITKMEGQRGRAGVPGDHGRGGDPERVALMGGLLGKEVVAVKRAPGKDEKCRRSSEGGSRGQ